jgi:hypothetical protein
MGTPIHQVVHLKNIYMACLKKIKRTSYLGSTLLSTSTPHLGGQLEFITTAL